MADILKISTPLVDKVPMQHNKPAIDPTVPFQLSDITKVIKTDAQNPSQQESNTLNKNNEAPEILMDMLKDPSVTVGYLKNILMLEEIINLIPLNNTTLTQEIEQMFSLLLVKPEDIAKELLRQEKTSTAFKGELFEILRNAIKESPTPEMRFAVTNLLKSLNGAITKEEILKSVSNGLEFISKNVSGNTSLSEKLMQLSQALRLPNASAAFIPLKDEVMASLREVEQSILFTPKLQKIIPLIIYNLSRFQDNPDFLKEATGALISSLDGDEKRELLLALVNRELNYSRVNKSEPSKVMEVIANIIGKQAANEELSAMSADKLEKVIHSLLSSPCNYTPLLHFIVPVDNNGQRAFAELWIDPNNEEGKNQGSRKESDSVHVLAVFDIERIGRFEAELFTYGKDLVLSLLCPEIYLQAFTNIGSSIAPILSRGGYVLKETKVAALERHRTLMDVFKELPHKRTGIDVKI